jgi:hypothetical protein
MRDGTTSEWGLRSLSKHRHGLPICVVTTMLDFETEVYGANKAEPLIGRLVYATWTSNAIKRDRVICLYVLKEYLKIQIGSAHKPEIMMSYSGGLRLMHISDLEFSNVLVQIKVVQQFVNVHRFIQIMWFSLEFEVVVRVEKCCLTSLLQTWY